MIVIQVKYQQTLNKIQIDAQNFQALTIRLITK